MNTPFPPFSQKLLVMTLSVALGIDFSSVANAVSVITMDGTTGANIAVPPTPPTPTPITPTGTTYIIDGVANGTINGSNLFFSFSKFGIAAGDTALFQCPSGCAGVTNVISRVTNGATPLNFALNTSNLLGTLTSTIGTANFWFFNPDGVGVSGAINVPVSASYFISNADRLNFNNGTFFGTGNPVPAASTLSAATPTAFGFPTTQAVSTVSPPAALNPAILPITSIGDITYPSPIIIKGTNTPPPPILTPVTVPPITPTVPTVPTTEPVPPAVVIEAPPLQISPQGDISMVVATQPVLTVAIPPLPKSMNPCNSDGQSTLISKGVANYVPQASSQVPQSIVGTTAGTTSLASIDQTPPSTSNEESDDCL